MLYKVHTMMNGKIIISLFYLGAGDALTLVGAVGFAFQIFLTGEFAPKYRVKVLNTVQMATAFLLSAVFLAAQGQFSVHATSTGWLSVLYLGACLLYTSRCV